MSKRISFNEAELSVLREFVSEAQSINDDGGPEDEEEIRAMLNKIWSKLNKGEREKPFAAKTSFRYSREYYIGGNEVTEEEFSQTTGQEYYIDGKQVTEEEFNKGK